MFHVKRYLDFLLKKYPSYRVCVKVDDGQYHECESSWLFDVIMVDKATTITGLSLRCEYSCIYIYLTKIPKNVSR